MLILHIGLAPVATTKRSNYLFQFSPPPFVSSPSPAPVDRLSRLPLACASDTIRCTVTWSVSTFGRNFWRGTSLRVFSQLWKELPLKKWWAFYWKIHGNPGIHWFIKKTAEKKNRKNMINMVVWGIYLSRWACFGQNDVNQFDGKSL